MGSLSRSATVPDFGGVTALALPDAFPVALYRNSDRYYSDASIGGFMGRYTGATRYVSESGDNLSGDGSEGAPFASLDRAISESSEWDRIHIDPGFYDMPSAPIDKSLAFLSPSGMSFIGSYRSLPTPTAVANGLYNISGVWAGLVRIDGVKINGVLGTQVVQTNAHCESRQSMGYSAIYRGSSTNVAVGSNESLIDLVAADKIRGFYETDVDAFVVGGSASVLIGDNITLASRATDVLFVDDSTGNPNLYVGDVGIYGGFNSSIKINGTGEFVFIGAHASGARGDILDADDNETVVEIGCAFGGAGWGTNDNASTMHDNAKCLRIGGSYFGSARVIHDVNNARAYIFSCTIRDAFDNAAATADQYLIISGDDPATDTSTLVYGDLTLSGVYVDTIVDRSTVSPVEIRLTDAWPY